jgi:hypothetical protein
MMNLQKRTLNKLIGSLFRLGDHPVQLSDSQLDIFSQIYFAKNKRTQIIAPTQYGKSLTVGLAVLTRVLTTNERFVIMAPSEKKAKIIMSYIIEHVFDCPDLAQRLEVDRSETLDRIRRERSKNNITFIGGGGVSILTLDARNSKRSIEAAMGFGGNRLILDESSLIDDTLYATVKRMLGGYDYDDQFLLEIGNPFYRNHFYRTWHSDRYHKIFIDYHTGIAEGRYNNEFIEEMREEAFFDVFYECRFPDEDAVDERGYRVLFPMDMVQHARTDAQQHRGIKRLGCDIGGGGDKNVYTVRSDTYAHIAGQNQSQDTMSNIVEIERIMNEEGIEAEHVFIDDTGIGRGVSDRMLEKGHNIVPVVKGEKAQDTTKFSNVRAECYWGAMEWMKAGGRIENTDRWNELNQIKYKVSSDKVIQIEKKEDLKRRLGKSPDYADSLILTFAPEEEQATSYETQPF